MPPIPQDTSYKPERTIDSIRDFIADPVAAATFPQTILRFRNDRAAAQLGLDHLTDDQWLAHFGRFDPLPGSLPLPLALRYHGHQFRNYNPDIGDGRGFLFAQLRDANSRLMDLGTKGSGQTPYSRFGDGRLTLKGAVREVLATEMLEALGVETSRTFSVIETGEHLNRGDEPSPTRSAVLVRLSHGHIRIGSFQRLAALRDGENMMRLTAYALQHYFGEDAGEDAPARLLTLVAQRTARLAASYMAAGFVHGVLNTDNINITGESFDYGPWRFTPFFDGGFTAAYFDESGLYAFGRQAEAIHWNVVQLAIALNTISEQDPLVDAINSFAPAYHEAIIDRMLWRLGIQKRGAEADLEVVNALEAALSPGEITIDRLFHDWAGGRMRDEPSSPGFGRLRAALSGAAPSRPLTHAYWGDPDPCAMHIEEVEAIWGPIAENDDWSAFDAKVAAIRRMGAALAENSEFAPS